MIDDYKGAWFGSAELKDEAVARMRAHRAEDLIVQGVYQEALHEGIFALDGETVDSYRGCALGCLLPLQDDLTKLDLGMSLDALNIDSTSRATWHIRVEDTFGIDRVIARAIDDIFEEQETFEDAARFAVAVMEAIPVGADLREVGATYLDWYRSGGGVGWNGSGTERAQYLIKELENAPIATGARAMILVG